MMATALDFGLAALLAQRGVYYVVATFVGMVVGGTANCIFNYRHVFCSHTNGCKVAARYTFVWLMSIVFNTLGTYVLTESIFGTRLFLAPKMIVAILVAIVWNYPLHKRYVFV